MSLVFDIGQGAGLAGATGVRPFLPPLLAGALASSDTGIDFDGTSFAFLEQPPFLLAVLVLAVIAYALDRSNVPRRALAIGTAVVAAALGALLFAGAMAAADQPTLIGVVGGIVCALLAQAAVVPLLRRAANRLDEGAAALLSVYADAAAIVLAAIAVFVEPLSFLALVAFVVLLVRGGGEDRKYAGLRILR